MKKLWKILCVTLIVILISPNFCLAALGKSENTQPLEWTAVPGNVTDGTDIIETGSIDVSDAYVAVLHIDVAISSTTAHTGTEIIVQIASEAGVDDAWSTLTRFIGPTGTCVKADFKAQEVAGQTVLSITDPVTQNMDNDGKLKFILANTVADSEIVYQIASGDDTADTITVLNPTTHQQETTSDIFDIDDAVSEGVASYAIELPASVSQANVIFNNNYDADGSQVHVRVRVTKLTGL